MASNNSTRKPISTELQLKKLKATEKTYDVKVADASGLILRVSKTGTKSFRWDRGGKHKPRIVTHGTYPSLSLKEAREAHQKARQRHVDGTLELSVITVEAPKTVNDLAMMFYEDRIVPKRKRPDIVQAILRKDILPFIGGMRLASVTPLVSRDVVKKVVDRGATNHAGKVLAIIKQMFRFGLNLGLVESNPAQSLDGSMLGVTVRKRKRTLGSEEIRQLWEITGSMPNKIVATALRMLLLTGLRSGEMRQARWKNLDWQAGTLIVPIEHQKLSITAMEEARPFVVPLPASAMHMLRQIEGHDDTYIYSGRMGGFISRNTLPLACRRDMDGIEPFTPHDLRRTMRTGLSMLKIQPHIAERCLNHSLGKIQDTYDTHDYLDERREALEKWSQHVQVIIGKHENVVSMEVV